MAKAHGTAAWKGMWCDCSKVLTHCCSLGAGQAMLQAGLIVAGWDARDSGSVYGVPLGGTLVKLPFTLGAASLLTAHHVRCSSAGVLKGSHACRCMRG